jgi:hypothetical protein
MAENTQNRRFHVKARENNPSGLKGVYTELDLRQLGLEYTRFVAENSVQDVSHVPAAEKQGIGDVFLWRLVGQ